MRRSTPLAHAGAALLAASCLLLASMSGAAPGRDLADSRILAALEHELLYARHVPSNDIDADVREGVATLSGRVGSLLEKERAVRVAQLVKGVRAVVDRIEVAPSGLADLQIEKNVETALLMDPATDSWEVEVSVEDGVATLTGPVDSYAEKELAATVAKSAKGVRGVVNGIDLDAATQRSDTEIAADVKRRLLFDVRVDDGMIDVAVENGVVTLSGSVGSSYEHSIAVGEAWVNGVKNVRSDPLEVQWWALDENRRKDFWTNLTDAQIEEAVRDALRYDPRVASFPVEVDVTARIATLRGTVEDLKAKRSAAQTARNTVGVWQVHNHLRVRPASPPGDEALEKRVRDALARDELVDSFDITVRADDGEVSLYGDVDAWFERAQAADAAARVAGVQEVENHLQVAYDFPRGYVPYYDWDPLAYDYDFDYETVRTRPDREIRQEIESELFWSPFVDADQVDVAVEDGVATLTGRVDTWSERRSAVENAFEGGAHRVRNRLEIDLGGAS